MKKPNYELKQCEELIWMRQASKKVDQFECMCGVDTLFNREQETADCISCGRTYRQVQGPTLTDGKDTIRVLEIDESRVVPPADPELTLDEYDHLNKLFDKLSKEGRAETTFDSDQFYELTPKAVFIGTVAMTPGLDTLLQGDNIWNDFRKRVEAHAIASGNEKPEGGIPMMIFTKEGLFGFAQIHDPITGVKGSASTH